LDNPETNCLTASKLKAQVDTGEVGNGTPTTVVAYRHAATRRKRDGNTMTEEQLYAIAFKPRQRLLDTEQYCRWPKRLQAGDGLPLVRGEIDRIERTLPLPAARSVVSSSRISLEIGHRCCCYASTPL
jgi:hypothetical protein